MSKSLSAAIQAVIDDVIGHVYDDLKIESTYNMQNFSLCSDVLEKTGKLADKLIKTADESLKTVEKIDSLWRPYLK